MAQLAAVAPITAISGPGITLEIHLAPTMTASTITEVVTA
jgi:hypothetical protein